MTSLLTMDRFAACEVCGKFMLVTKSQMYNWKCPNCAFARREQNKVKTSQFSKTVDPIIFICKICGSNENLNTKEDPEGNISVFCKIHSLKEK